MKTDKKKTAARRGHRLVILSGPSCAGKSPLKHAFRRMYPDLSRRLPSLVVYDERLPRPGEQDGVDYHSRSRRFIQDLKKKEGFIVMEVRGEYMAVDVGELKRSLRRTDVLYEGNPFIALELMSHAALRNVSKVSVFLVPLSRDEIVFFQGLSPRIPLASLLTELMRRKLLRRTARQKGRLSLPDLENIEARAESAHHELKTTWRFDHVVVNHDGEDSDHWSALPYPVGEARASVMAFADILCGRTSAREERWEKDLLKAVS